MYWILFAHDATLLVSILFMLVSQFAIVQSSIGDNSPLYRVCLKKASAAKCHRNTDAIKFIANQPLSERLLKWSCEDDSKYHCMWETVDAFKSEGLKVPQFHGKWPFVRLFGIQEPASMVFSVMNGCAHYVGLRAYLSKASPHSPLYYPSICFAAMAINAWVWSTIFHTRDYPFTEKMDYFSATAGMLYSIYYCLYRMSLGLTEPSLKRGGMIRKLVPIILFGFFVRHVTYLVGFFDYGYNMQVNVLAGLLNGFLWLAYHYRTRKKYSHQWTATYAIIYTTVLLGLELLDFAPIFWVFDAHSLWHFGTILFPFLWYPFMIKESDIVDNGMKIA